MEEKKKIDEAEFYNMCSTFVEREVYVNQNRLIEECFSKDIMFIDDIENFYSLINEEETEYDDNGDEIEKPKCQSCNKPNDLDKHGYCCDCQTPQDIFEWWIISNWLADKLKEKGHPVLDNDYGVYWGRTCSGQPIKMDGVIRELVKELWC